MSSSSCETLLPPLLSSFIDTFIDFTVSGGLFLPPDPNPFQQTQTHFPNPTRLIAIGDLHGDLTKTKQSLSLSGLIQSPTSDKWTGGSTTLVQVGDILDRGGDEIKILYLFEKLRREAVTVGGRVITMNGNHEIMNVDGDFRYVTKRGFEEFENWAEWQCVGNVMKRMCGVETDFLDVYEGVPDKFDRIKPELLSGVRARIAGLRPNGLVSSRFLGKNETVVVVGDSVFAHGGLLGEHVGYGLERLNEEVREWVKGGKERMGKGLVRGKDSIVWLRRFSNELGKDCDCEMLEHVLQTIPGVRRMVMGHTIQDGGINAVCGDKAVRIDVGMSEGCGGKFAEVLEVTKGGGVRILTSNPKYAKGYEGFVESVEKKGIGSLVPEERARQVEVSA